MVRNKDTVHAIRSYLPKETRTTTNILCSPKSILEYEFLTIYERKLAKNKPGNTHVRTLQTHLMGLDPTISSSTSLLQGKKCHLS